MISGLHKTEDYSNFDICKISVFHKANFNKVTEYRVLSPPIAEVTDMTMCFHLTCY